MRVAALSDVHGNLPALEAVLADVERAGVDAVVSGGDVVAGPFPAECLELLEAAGARFVRGNADREVVEEPPSGAARWCAARLPDERREAVRRWPATQTVEVAGLGPVLFCHGSPRSDEEVLTEVTPGPEITAALAGVRAALVVCGHTHHQFDRRAAGSRLDEKRRGAYWAPLGPNRLFGPSLAEPRPKAEAVAFCESHRGA